MAKSGLDEALDKCAKIIAEAAIAEVIDKAIVILQAKKKAPNLKDNKPVTSPKSDDSASKELKCGFCRRKGRPCVRHGGALEMYVNSRQDPKETPPAPLKKRCAYCGVFYIVEDGVGDYCTPEHKAIAERTMKMVQRDQNDDSDDEQGTRNTPTMLEPASAVPESIKRPIYKPGEAGYDPEWNKAAKEINSSISKKYAKAPGQ